jgi:hypothetical protein
MLRSRVRIPLMVRSFFSRVCWVFIFSFSCVLCRLQILGRFYHSSREALLHVCVCECVCVCVPSISLKYQVVWARVWLLCHTHSLTHSLTHTHTQHSHTNTLTHSHTLTHTHSLTHTLTHSHTLTHTHSLTLTHSHTHTHTHTHTQSFFQNAIILQYVSTSCRFSLIGPNILKSAVFSNFKACFPHNASDRKVSVNEWHYCIVTSRYKKVQSILCYFTRDKRFYSVHTPSYKPAPVFVTIQPIIFFDFSLPIYFERRL